MVVSGKLAADISMQQCPLCLTGPPPQETRCNRAFLRHRWESSLMNEFTMSAGPGLSVNRAYSITLEAPPFANCHTDGYVVFLAARATERRIFQKRLLSSFSRHCTLLYDTQNTRMGAEPLKAISGRRSAQSFVPLPFLVTHDPARRTMGLDRPCL